jgi:hypothetical protein
MHIRKTVRAAAVAGALAATLSILTPALAADAPGADIARGAMPPGPAMPDVPPPPPRLPDPRPDWNGSRPNWNRPPPMMEQAPAIMQVDPRTRDIWLSECRRRMEISYRSGWDDDYGWKRHRHHHDEARATSGDYCETYFDDYYRHYAAPMMMRPAGLPGPAARNCVTEEHVSYVPVRSRYIPRRHVKRIPDKRIRLQGS